MSTTQHTDFKASISITNPSPITKQMQNLLPSNYTRSQNSNSFAFLYGTGYEMENLKQTIGQAEANNYLHSPSTQNGQITVGGQGRYLVEFDIPFVVPPLNVSISSASSSTDAFIEFTSRYGMTINVATPTTDTISWQASGQVGAATTQYLGDALYDNFGVLYGFPRQGDSVIDDSFVSQYENFNLFVKVENMVTVLDLSAYPGQTQYNAPPPGAIRGRLRPTTVLTNPGASHELIDANGKIIALLAFEVSGFTLAGQANQPVSKFLPESLFDNYGGGAPLPTYDVYVSGPQTTFAFNRWDQIAYQQEVFRADNAYRRLLAGIARSLRLGPTIDGVSSMFETIFGQPYIPQDVWDASDFRIFKNPKYLTYTKDSSGTVTAVNAESQKDGYPTVPPVVEVFEITSDWTPDSLTYNNKPIIQPLRDIEKVQITELNTGTQFNITNEVVRQLRVGIDLPTGGIADWNFLLNAVYSQDSHGAPVVNNQYYSDGVAYNGTTYEYNYFFLNNANDSVSNIKLFYYAKQTNADGTPHYYKSYGPLIYGRDFFAISTADLYDPTTNGGKGGYWLPAELLVNYACNSNLPALGTHGELVTGSNYIYNKNGITKPQLPAVVIKLDLSIGNYTAGGTKFPSSVDDFILYSYADVSCLPGSVLGTFDADATHTPKYYDPHSALTVQPSDSPFTGSSVQLAQGSFGRFTSDSGMKYVTTMTGGQVTFNKTVSADSLLSPVPVDDQGAALGPAGILVMQVIKADAYAGVPYTYTGDTFAVAGTIIKNIDPNTGRPYFQIDNATYLLVNQSGYPCAIITDSSPWDVSQYVGSGVTRVFTGLVQNMLWDTRIPVTDYYADTSPVFQASDNFDVAVVPFTPDLTDAQGNLLPVLPVNQNFMVLIQGLPIGNQQTVTASWTFNVAEADTSFVPITSGLPSLLFADYTSNGTTQAGIVSYYTGNKILRDLGVDPDGAIYDQEYVSPTFDAYFIDYKDYLNTQYGNGVQGGKLSAQGDSSDFDTVFGNETTPGSAATILNFFSPTSGFFSISVLPGMEFYTGVERFPIAVTRPRNKGIALRITGDSYAGLAFYGRGNDKIIDKPTRLLVDFTYTASQKANRHRIVEIQDDTYAGWVDGMHPDEVQTSSTFFLAGNQFKFAHQGADQAPNGYTANTYPVQVNSSVPTAEERYSLVSNPPTFETDPSLLDANSKPFATPSMTHPLASPAGSPGYPQRYRRPPVIAADSAGNEYFDPSYQNYTPEKIAYFKFDFDSFPVDTLIKTAVMEVYFCSGFTIAEANDKNATLSYNNLWNRSRLSGNGGVTTYTVTKPDFTTRTVYRPYNAHWRKNFFEVILPYAFESADEVLPDTPYGIANLFGPTDSEEVGVVQYPPTALQYLGSINVNEIAVAPLPVDPNIYIETTEGLSNIVLTNDSQVFQVFGTLQCDAEGVPDISAYNSTTGKGLPLKGSFYDAAHNPPNLNIDQTSGLPSGFRYASPIDVAAVLPNMKILVFPFGANITFVNDSNGNPQPVLDTNAEFVYGYVKSFVPPAQIAFNEKSIALYQQLIDYVCPLYAQYDIKLLESDTYFPFTSFGKVSNVDNTNKDISF